MMYNNVCDIGQRLILLFCSAPIRTIVTHETPPSIIKSSSQPNLAQVYEGLEFSGGNRKAWGARGSAGHRGGGDSTGESGRGGGSLESSAVGGGGGGGSYAEDEVRAAERLGISVREVSLTVDTTEEETNRADR